MIEDSLKRLHQIAILTGSRAFNCHNEDSDYDFVITEQYADSLNSDFIPCNKILDPSQEVSNGDEYSYSLYGDDLVDIVRFTNSEGYNINLFIFENESIYDKFKLVNKYMNDSKFNIKDKSIRIEEWINALYEYGISNLEEDGEIAGRPEYRRG